MKGARLQPPVIALTHHPLHVLVRDLEIFQQRTFEVTAAVRISGHLLHPLQGQAHMALLNRLPKRLRSPEVSMGKLFDFPHAQFLAAHRHHKIFDLLLFHPVHAHELPQRVHVRVNRKAAAEDLLPHLFAHLADQPQPHAHPCLAPRQFLCNLRHAHLVQPPQFVDESGLFQNAEGSVVGGPQEIHDAQGFVVSQQGIRRSPNAQLPCTAVALESVQQYAPFLRIHPLQRLLDASLRDGSEQPRLERRIPHPVALVSQIQARKLHLSSHVEPLRSMFVQILQNIINPAAADHAVLSHRPGQHLQNLIRAHPPALDQTRDHPQIAHHVRVKPALLQHQVAPFLLDVAKTCLPFHHASLAVLYLLLELALFGAVVLHAALGRTSLTVRILAPEGTTQIVAPGITWMRQEEYPAVPAAGQASPKAGLGPQYGPENEIVLQHESPDLAHAVPARPKLKMGLDFDGQKPSVSLMMLMSLGMASSYTIGTPCVER